MGYRQLGNEKGLTIVETVISIAIFSFLIVFCLAMFIFLGRIYYKGLYEAAVQETARSVVDNIAEALRTSGQAVDTLPLQDDNGWQAYCIGNKQYSYRKNTQLITEEDAYDRQADEVFILTDQCNAPNPEPIKVWTPNPGTSDGMCDGATGSNYSSCTAAGGTWRPRNGTTEGSCSDPNPVYNTYSNLGDCAYIGQRVELLRERMRILDFSIDAVGSDVNLYKISLKIAYGGDLNDLEFDETVFEYEEENPPGSGSWVDLMNSLDTSNYGSLNRWPEQTGHHDGMNDTPYFKGIRVDKCQPAETFCAVIEIRTQVYRKIL